MRPLVSVALIGSLIIACAQAWAANTPAAPADAKPAAAAKGKSTAKASDADKDDPPASDEAAPQTPRIIAPKAPTRSDNCGLFGARTQNPFNKDDSLAQQVWDDKTKVGYALLTDGSYVWADLKDCKGYNVTAKLIVPRGPKAADTKYWLKRIAQVTTLLQGPFLEDEATALDRIAQSGKWFTRKTSGGASFEFPPAMEHVQLTATVTDYEDMTILVVQQQAS